MMRTELHTILPDFTEVAEGEYLKTAGIGKQRFIVIHEFMKTAGSFNNIGSGAQINMICIR